MANDDWKGEALIRAKPTRQQQVTEGRRVIANVVHEKKRKDGTNMARLKTPWATSITAWHLAGKNGEG